MCMTVRRVFRSVALLRQHATRHPLRYEEHHITTDGTGPSAGFGSQRRRLHCGLSPSWRHVPVDRATSQGNLSITARGLAAIGELVKNSGVVAGKQVLNREWVETSLAAQVPISTVDPYAEYYGYMWYTRAESVGTKQILVHFASGNGGNKVYIVPSLHLVVAITSSAYNTNYGQRRSHDILLDILAATR